MGSLLLLSYLPNIYIELPPGRLQVRDLFTRVVFFFFFQTCRPRNRQPVLGARVKKAQLFSLNPEWPSDRWSVPARYEPPIFQKCHPLLGNTSGLPPGHSVSALPTAPNCPQAPGFYLEKFPICCASFWATPSGLSPGCPRPVPWPV